MKNSSILIREISEKDNIQIAELIRSVIVEFSAPKVGTAYEDKALDNLYRHYQKEGCAYFVLADGDRIIGAAGIAPLQEGPSNICELQKMYFLPEARGRGFGKELIEKCLEKAKELHFHSCYIETMPNMLAAQKLYRRNGFEYINQPMGNTGHHSCSVWLLKEEL